MSRQRLVRDYSTDSLLAPPSRPRASSSHSRLNSPQHLDRKRAMDRPISPEELEDLRRLDFDLAAVDEEESYAPSIDTQHTQHTSATGSSSSRIADFFGPEVFQVVLHNPTTAHQLKKFAHSRLCGENLEFLEKVSSIASGEGAS